MLVIFHIFVTVNKLHEKKKFSDALVSFIILSNFPSRLWHSDSRPLVPALCITNI